MIAEIKYKGEKININDLEIFYTNDYGNMCYGSIEDYGLDRYSEGYEEGYSNATNDSDRNNW